MKDQQQQSNETTQNDILMEYFTKNPHRDIKHPEIVDWAVNEFRKRTGKIFRDPDRQIRKLHQLGILKKMAKGVYRYDPEFAKRKELEDFSSILKEKIFKRDNYRCVICGRGRKEGVDIHVDHIKPKEFGGKATLENGQTLCGPHNMLKKTLRQTETGKKMFIRLYELAKKENNKELLKFCTEILEVFEKNDINGHIIWIR
jgi:hypothetical protein